MQQWTVRNKPTALDQHVRTRCWRNVLLLALRWCSVPSLATLAPSAESTTKVQPLQTIERMQLHEEQKLSRITGCALMHDRAYYYIII
jgi:hypothetical protein